VALVLIVAGGAWMRRWLVRDEVTVALT